MVVVESQKMKRSFRLRLQLWHVTLLMAVLVVFGVAIAELQRRARTQQIDAELHRLAELVIARMRPKSGSYSWGRGQAPRSNPSGTAPSGIAPSGTPSSETPPSSGDDQRRDRSEQTNRSDHSGDRRRSGWPSFQMELPPEVLRLFDNEDDHKSEPVGFYFVIWKSDGQILHQSADLPVDIPLPLPAPRSDENVVVASIARQRDDLREVIHEMRFGMQILVGRSVQSDWLADRQFVWLLVSIGCGVLVAGNVGGWLIAGRMMKPIETIGATAAAISSSNLSQRIDVAETDNELSQLADVLNQTFDRLEAAFEQQVRFTADASHELRTPLSVILLHSEMALSEPRSADEYLTALDACQRAALRMKSLIESLLTLARFDSGQMGLQRQELDLAELVAESLDLLQPLAEERAITVTGQCQETLVIGDRLRLAQVMTNLISNAIRYNRDGGNVDVQVAEHDGWATVTVTDTGIGIPPEDLPHIFERFYRADKARTRTDGSSGLGLAICHSITQAHRGSIVARSEFGEGTTLELRLPLASSVSSHPDNLSENTQHLVTA